jgi:pimeloyl-ACP methyl ester carboxylesterase
MPQVQVDRLTINYEVQGEGEPLLLIPYTSADHACYAFQLPAYTEHFSCIAIDLPGSGESDKPAGPYSTDGYADQVAAFLGAIGVERAHVAGLRSARRWASTWPPAIPTVCVRSRCTAAGTPATTI